MKKIFIINGPNLNFLGIRETGIYGNDNYDSLCSYIQEKFRDKNIKIEIFQSNYEGRIIDIIQNAYYEKIDGIVATIMALDRSIRHQKNDGSIYDERGILSF